MCRLGIVSPSPQCQQQIYTTGEGSPSSKNYRRVFWSLLIFCIFQYTAKPKDCFDYLDIYQLNDSGIYYIWPVTSADESGVKVWCDMETDGGGWTVIQF